MRCPRCGRAAADASWYCAHCGAELAGVNVADSLGSGRLPALVRWALLASVTLLVAVAVVAGGVVLGLWRGPGPGQRAASVAGQPTASGSVAAEPPQSGAIDATAQAELLGHAPRIVTPAAQLAARPTPPVRPDAPAWRLDRLPEPPVLDGLVDEWSGTVLDISTVVLGRDFWHGPSDLGAHAYGGWDATALYLAVDVTDDVFSQPASGDRLYLGDSLQLQLDTDLAADWESGTLSGDDWQIGVSPGDFAGRPPEAYVWQPVPGPAPDVRVASRRHESGYAVELAVPWALLGLDPTTVGGVGLALGVSDNDDPRPAQLSLVASAPVWSNTDPRTFSTAILADRGSSGGR